MLRLKRIVVHFSDFEVGRGTPYQCHIVRKFGDGTVLDAPAGPSHGVTAPLHRSPNRACYPLTMAKTELRDAFDAAATELAIFASSPVLAEVDKFRRLALLIESSCSGKPWEQRLRRDPAFQKLLADVVQGNPSLASNVPDVIGELVGLYLPF